MNRRSIAMLRLVDLFVACVFSSCSTSGGFSVQLTRRYGALGGLITLRCRFTPRESNITRVTWFQKTNVMYIYDAINASANGAANAFLQRNVTVSHNEAGGYQDLIIPNSLPQDRGSYRCDVTNNCNETVGTELQLRLVDPARIGPTIRTMDGKLLTRNCHPHNKSKPYAILRNKMHTLHCISGASRPKSNITWTIKNSTVHGNWHFIIPGKIRGNVIKDNTHEVGSEISSTIVLQITGTETFILHCLVSAPSPGLKEWTATDICIPINAYEADGISIGFLFGLVFFAFFALFKIMDIASRQATCKDSRRTFYCY